MSFNVVGQHSLFAAARFLTHIRHVFLNTARYMISAIGHALDNDGRIGDTHIIIVMATSVAVDHFRNVAKR